MDKNQLVGSWHEVKGKVKQQWSKLTDDDLTRIHGKYEELCGSLQKHYGYTKEEAEKHIKNFLDTAKID